MFSSGVLSVSALVFCVLDVVMCVIYIRAPILLLSCIAFLYSPHIPNIFFYLLAKCLFCSSKNIY